MNKYPRGKLNANDEGRVAFRFFIQDRTLIIDFGKPVAWLGLGLAEVAQMRELLEKYERELRGTAT